jgi:DNA-binding PadR family transcriptional regulator
MEAPAMTSDPQACLPLAPRVFYVLLALAEEERHGYAISKTVEQMTSGHVRLTPGSLYPLVHQMLLDEWIVPAPEDTSDTRRRRYKLTARGRRIAQAEARRLDDLVRMARSFNLLPAGGRP